MSSLESLLQSLAGSGVLWLYAALFGSAIIETMFPPYPGDTVIIISGYLVGVGRLDLLGVLLSSAAGSLTGAWVLYSLGLIKGRPFFQSGRYPFFSPQRLLRVETLFQRHGGTVVLMSRFLAGVRSLVAVSAGIGRMKLGLFLLLSTVSILAWSGLLMYLGMKVGQNWEKVAGWFRVYNGLIVALVALAIVIWLLVRQRRVRSQHR
ncbi:DedA family protein [Candidatus Zixiibacteriota bacterium]